MDFIQSETGQSIMTSATTFLQQLSQSSVIETFSTTLASAAGIYSQEEEPQNDPPCINLSMWNDVTQRSSAEVLLNFLKELFRSLMIKGVDQATNSAILNI